MAAPNPLLQAIKGGVAPEMIRLAAAKGTLPLSPEVILEAQVLLAKDKSEEVKKASRNSLSEYQTDELSEILENKNLPVEVLYFCAVFFINKGEIVEKILLNPGTSSNTFLAVAPLCSRSLAELIISNQVRLIETPQIIAALRKNPNLTPGNLRALSEIEEHFLVESEDKTPPKATGQDALFTEGEKMAQAAESASVSGTITTEPTPGEERPPSEQMMQEEEPDLTSQIPTEPSPAQLEAIDDLSGGDPEKMTLYQKVAGLPVSEKIKLALLGKREERALLIKDSNKMVSALVLQSPKISDSEIETYSQLRNVSGEVLRIIGNTREWTKNHKIALNLVKNPKTPVPVASTLIRRLTVMDLKLMVRNRAIPEVIRRQAKRLLDLRQH